MLFLRLITWQRDSHGLFDYESQQTDKFEFKARSAGFLTRSGEKKEDSNEVTAMVAFQQQACENTMAEIQLTNKGTYSLVRYGEDENSYLWRVVSRKLDLESESPAADLVSSHFTFPANCRGLPGKTGGLGRKVRSNGVNLIAGTQDRKVRRYQTRPLQVLRQGVRLRVRDPVPGGDSPTRTPRSLQGDLPRASSFSKRLGA